MWDVVVALALGIPVLAVVVVFRVVDYRHDRQTEAKLKEEMEEELEMFKRMTKEDLEWLTLLDSMWDEE